MSADWVLARLEAPPQLRELVEVLEGLALSSSVGGETSLSSVNL